MLDKIQLICKNSLYNLKAILFLLLNNYYLAKFDSNIFEKLIRHVDLRTFLESTHDVVFKNKLPVISFSFKNLTF